MCPHCLQALAHIGEVITEQMEFIPALLLVIQYARQKYACRRCHNHIVTAPMPPQPIDKGVPGPGLLAEILVNKYQDALPLYRQAQRWQRLGYEIPSSTSGNWIHQCAKLLEPLVLRMKTHQLLTTPKIHTDDTPCPVQVNHKNKTHTGRLWVYVATGAHGPPVTIYDYSIFTHPSILLS